MWSDRFPRTRSTWISVTGKPANIAGTLSCAGGMGALLLPANRRSLPIRLVGGDASWPREARAAGQAAGQHDASPRQRIGHMAGEPGLDVLGYRLPRFHLEPLPGWDGGLGEVFAGLLDATVTFAQAAAEAGVRSVVNTSQISARREATSNAARQHWLAERLLDRSPMLTAHLKPTFFAERVILAWGQHEDHGVLRLPSEPARSRWTTTASRGWRRLRLLSAAGSTYNRDYLAETADGSQQPMLNVFHRDGDVIRHYWGSDLFYAPADQGQETRHVGTIEPLWNLFDLTRDGRPADWHEQLSY